MCKKETKQWVTKPRTFIWRSYYYYLFSTENVLDCRLYYPNVLWVLIIQKIKLFLIMQYNIF